MGLTLIAKSATLDILKLLKATPVLKIVLINTTKMSITLNVLYVLLDVLLVNY